MNASPSAVTHNFANAAVPIIDLSGYFTGDPQKKAAVARQIDEACRTIGFLVISGHGVAPDIVERAAAVTRAFYDLPLEAKRAYAPKPPDFSRGYYGIETSVLAATIGEESLPDYRETFTFGLRNFDPADPYYTSPEGIKAFP